MLLEALFVSVLYLERPPGDRVEGVRWGRLDGVAAAVVGVVGGVGDVKSTTEVASSSTCFSALGGVFVGVSFVGDFLLPFPFLGC